MISISIRTSGIRRKIIENKLRTLRIEHMSVTHVTKICWRTPRNKKTTEERVGKKIAQAIEDPLLVSEQSLLYIRKMKLNTNRQINICLPIDACREMRSEKPKRVRNVHRFRTLHVTRAPNRIKRIIALSHFCALDAWCKCAHYIVFIIRIIYVGLLLTKARKKDPLMMAFCEREPFH